MRFDGMNFTKAKNLLYRMAKDGDTYANGESVPKNYVVVVRPKDCKLVSEEGNTRVYNTDDALCIGDMTGHSTTNMFYGKWNKRSREYGVLVRNLDKGFETVEFDYYQMTVYLVNKGRVYKASIKRAMTPKQEKIVKNEY